uniref:CRISPR-associated endonuclease Cas2 n=1 Tax=Candidatus Cryptobacteroides bacterium TaxID=3085639 RepID=UPI003FEF7326
MYVILVYDVGEKRVGKMLKLCRRYLSWVQNSVLEGNLSKAQLRALRIQIDDIIDKDEDSVILFSSRMEYSMDKEILGKERMSVDNFL